MLFCSMSSRFWSFASTISFRIYFWTELSFSKEQNNLDGFSPSILYCARARTNAPCAWKAKIFSSSSFFSKRLSFKFWKASSISCAAILVSRLSISWIKSSFFFILSLFFFDEKEIVSLLIYINKTSKNDWGLIFRLTCCKISGFVVA